MKNRLIELLFTRILNVRRSLFLHIFSIFALLVTIFSTITGRLVYRFMLEADMLLESMNL